MNRTHLSGLSGIVSGRGLGAVLKHGVWTAALVMSFASLSPLAAATVVVDTGQNNRLYGDSPYTTAVNNPTSGQFTGFNGGTIYSKAIFIFDTVGSSELDGQDFASLSLEFSLQGITNVAPNQNLLDASVNLVVFTTTSPAVTASMWSGTSDLATFSGFVTSGSSAGTYAVQSAALDSAVNSIFSSLTSDTYLGVRLEFTNTPAAGSATGNTTVHFYNFYAFNQAEDIRPNAIFTVVPEPSVAAMLVGAGFAVVSCRRRRLV